MLSTAIEVNEETYNPFKQVLKDKWSMFRPYVPEEKEYNFELGSMWEENNQYWMGGLLGFHIGRCIFSKSQSCQQYADLIGGVGGREGLTHGLALSSVRWQFANLDKVYSTHARIFAGAMNQRDEDRDRTIFTYGMGYGVTSSVHERLDLRLEGRVGYGDRVWGQTFVSFSFKMDSIVDYFAQKLEGMGTAGKILKGIADITGKVIRGTVETTGKVLKGTVEQTGKVVEKTGEAVGVKNKDQEGGEVKGEPKNKN